MNSYKEIEAEESDGDSEQTKQDDVNFQNRHQREGGFRAKQLHVFEKGTKTKRNRQPVEDDSSDDEGN